MPIVVSLPREPVEPDSTPPTFSIVITAYQAADTIGDAIRSALAQVHPAHEVIVVDDGSTDDLMEALRPFDDRIVTIRKENGGGASARNAGVRAATGEFMAVLDADDTYHPRRLQVLAELARIRPDLDLVTTDARFVVNGEGKGSFYAENSFPTEGQRTAIFESCFVGGWPAVRLSRLHSIGGFDETFRIGYDWDCWLRLILDGAEAGMVDEPLYDYVLHPGSLSASRVASFWERVRLLEKASDNPALRPEERPVLEGVLQRRRATARLAETQAAVAQSQPGFRRRCLELARTPMVSVRDRLWALAVFASPGRLRPALIRIGAAGPQQSRLTPPDERAA